MLECTASQCPVSDLEKVLGKPVASQYANGQEYRLYRHPVEFGETMKIVARVGRGDRIESIKIDEEEVGPR